MERTPTIPSETPSPTTAPKRVPFSSPPGRIDLDAVKVVRRLTRHGHTAYLVGGCVRDLLLRRTPKDFDVATSARPSEVRALFRNCRVIGRRFRLAHILFPMGKVIEVATFRKDPGVGTEAVDWENPDETPEETDERTTRARTERDGPNDLLIRHDNVFGDPNEDAARRDFTINALFYDLERQEIVDYVGGLREINRRVLRTIGEPDVRFREDPIRILRALKFSARLDLGIDPDTYDAMVVHGEELLRAARPRLFEELLRLMRGGAARRSFWLAWETGVLSVILPELSSWLDDAGVRSEVFWRRLGLIDEHTVRGEVLADPVLFTSLLLDPLQEMLEGERDVSGALVDQFADVIERLAVPRRMIDRMRQILSVQRRLRQGKVGSLGRRDFYEEAMAVYTLDQSARSNRPPQRPRSNNAHKP